MTAITLTVPMSIGGDTPTWEGDATFTVDFTYRDIGDVTCIAVDGRLLYASDREDRAIAESLEAHVDGEDWFEDAAWDAYFERDAETAERRAEAKWERAMEPDQ